MQAFMHSSLSLRNGSIKSVQKNFGQTATQGAPMPLILQHVANGRLNSRAMTQKSLTLWAKLFCCRLLLALRQIFVPKKFVVACV